MSLRDDSMERPYDRENPRSGDAARNPADTATRIVELIAEARGGKFSAPPDVVCRLLRAMASGTDAQANRHDVILIAAAEMIERFEKRAADHEYDRLRNANCNNGAY